MDWSNERYVRLYVRDTTTWKKLGFEGQAMFCLLIRKLDRTGILEIDDAPPWEAAMLHVNAPEEVARVGVQRLLSCKVLEHIGDKLIVPNFLDAQEASMSPTMRQKEHRMRRRDELRSGLDASQRETVIYFIQSEHGGEVKIGRANDVAKRLMGLQTSRPDKLVLLAAAPGTIEQERLLHDRFARHRSKGEWFFAADELMALVADVRETGAIAFGVTKRDESQNVTSHETFAVTPCLAFPSVPSMPDDREAPDSFRDALVDQTIEKILSEPPPPFAAPRPANDLAERRQRDSGPPEGAATRRATFDAQAQRVAFQRAYEAKMRTAPGMGGKQVGEFNDAVLRTAFLQSRDPRELFTSTLDAWLSRPHTDVERRSPYACFCQAWSDLTSKGERSNGKPPERELSKATQDALANAAKLKAAGKFF